VSTVYFIRPKADQGLDDQAYYLSTQAGPDLGHRFLLAAHETFGLLATQPQIGWHPRLIHPDLASLRVFPVRASRKCSCSINLLLMESRFYEWYTVQETSEPCCVVKKSDKQPSPCGSGHSTSASFRP
jgi:plasmid stabilization system protein ParE